MASLASTSTFPAGRVEVAYTVQLQRNLAVASNYVESPVQLPVGFTPTELAIIGGNVASDAGTAALLAIGSSGYNSTDFLASYELKTTTGVTAWPSSTKLIGSPLAFPTTVCVTYAEYGTASTTGGPWTVVIRGIPGPG